MGWDGDGDGGSLKAVTDKQWGRPGNWIEGMGIEVPQVFNGHGWRRDHDKGSWTESCRVPEEGKPGESNYLRREVGDMGNRRIER